GRPLEVGHRRDGEERRGHHEDDRREAEGALGDHSQDEVDRRADGAEPDRRQPRRADSARHPHPQPGGQATGAAAVGRLLPARGPDQITSGRFHAFPPRARRVARNTRAAPSRASAAPTSTPSASGPPPPATVRTTIATPRTSRIVPIATVDRRYTRPTSAILDVPRDTAAAAPA